ncbi:DUF938 domain-containing protein [Parvularcula marina]|uniref:DUF938 domain-containing protein n=1 Tax=Parvularcula marina TaxID=2292771 RepID=A0A371RH36_9PROT|nr:DUF938 domain-containing protein [Parvularcula marina]RFB04756.1 DUF938 domain-containing protein [Parvularcula marina]
MTHEHHSGSNGKQIALEERMAHGAKLTSPSVARNRDVILEAFRKHMPTNGLILEIASGTGEHGAYLTKALPDLIWQPSDPDENSRVSITAYGEDISGGRLHLPFSIDVTEYGWWDSPDIGNIDGMVSINMTHITHFNATEGLFRGAAALLKPGERLFFYGPYSINGEMAESNRAFDADLKRRDPEWGVRDLEAQILPLAHNHAFHLIAAEHVPANNMVVVFEKG